MSCNVLHVKLDTISNDLGILGNGGVSLYRSESLLHILPFRLMLGGEGVMHLSIAVEKLFG
jgi:hypothetical protein